MATGEDYVLRPVMRGMCTYESLKSGALDLNDIATMNDAIDVDETNRSRMQEWMTKNG